MRVGVGDRAAPAQVGMVAEGCRAAAAAGLHSLAAPFPSWNGLSRGSGGTGG